VSGEARQHLPVIRRSNGRNEDTVRRELIEERRRHLLDSRREHDPRKWRSRRETGGSIGEKHLDIADVQFPQTPGRRIGQSAKPLQRHDALSDAGDDRGVVAGPRPDLQNRVFRAKIKRLRHPRDQRRLADGLAAFNGEGLVRPGEVAECRIDEAIAGHVLESGHYSAIEDAALTKRKQKLCPFDSLVSAHLHYRALPPGTQPIRQLL